MSDDVIPASKVLRRAAELIEQGWCRFVSARDEDGKIVSPLSLVAASWCLTGAVARAHTELRGDELGPFTPKALEDGRLDVPCGIPVALRAALREAGVSTINPGAEVRWNNTQKKGDSVARLLRRAADLADNG